MSDTATLEVTATPRLKQKYTDEVKAQLIEQLGLPNVMQVPKLDKIVVNMGVGRATQRPSLTRAPSATSPRSRARSRSSKAPKSIAAFKLREGQAIGTKVTLRGDRMWEFLDRLSPSPSPASATSAGCRPSRGTAGATTRSARRADRVPRDRLRPGRPDRGMDITIVTSATDNAGGKALLDAFGFPFRTGHRTRRPSRRQAQAGPTAVPRRQAGQEEVRGTAGTMAKKALINKAAAKPKFKVHGYTRCRRCGCARSVYRKFGLCRVCLRELAHAGEIPGLTKSSW